VYKRQGFAYRVQEREDLIYVVGLPLSSVTWKPNDQFELEVTYSIPDTFEARASYEIVKNWKAYAALENVDESFHLDDAPEDRQLFFKQRRVEAGVQFQPTESIQFQLGVGYAFSQEFTTGWDVRDDDLVRKVSDEPYVRLAAEIRF